MSSASPLVSVVVPTYYRNDKLTGALDSVATQEHTPIETIVVDDSGEEHARETVNHRKESIEYLSHDENRGAQAARNTGVEYATGDYVQFLDDDDRLKPTKIARQITLLDGRSDTGVAVCGLESESGEIELPTEDMCGDVLRKALSFGGRWETTTLLIRRSVLERILPLDETSEGADDIRMRIRLACETKFDVISEALAVRGDPGDRALTPGAVRERWRIIDEFDALYQRHPSVVKREALAETYWIEARARLERNAWSLKATRAFALAAYYSPSSKQIRAAEAIMSIGGRLGLAAGGSVLSFFERRTGSSASADSMEE